MPSHELSFTIPHKVLANLFNGFWKTLENKKHEVIDSLYQISLVDDLLIFSLNGNIVDLADIILNHNLHPIFLDWLLNQHFGLFSENKTSLITALKSQDNLPLAGQPNFFDLEFKVRIDFTTTNVKNKLIEALNDSGFSAVKIIPL